MKGIVDFHTHAFPDEIAAKAMKRLAHEGAIKPRLNGTVASLLCSMDACGIEKSVVCSIATKPAQFDPIIEWSRTIRTERIIPLPSLHPDDREAVKRVSQIKDEGFSGIKFHPYYQDFVIDDKKMFPIYEEIVKNNLIVVMHTGFDFAFERKRIADPVKILNVVNTFPKMKIVTTHCGSWDDWDEAEKHLVGKDIYMEISFSLEYLHKERAQSIISRHPAEYMLFGTDSPWTDQEKTLSLLRDLNLGQEREELMLRTNAMQLLGSVSN